MKKSFKIIICLIMFIFAIITSLIILKCEVRENDNTKICCNNECFNLELADTNESRQRGLMYRKKLSDNEGMLFIFDKPGIYSFRMKNTLIPLAGVRLDSDLKIVDIIKMEPCKTNECPSYTPKSTAKYVLEINQGFINKKGSINIGDSCKLIKNNTKYK